MTQKARKTGGVTAKCLMASVALYVLAGCQSPPALRQVAQDAPEKPINTPEVAAQIKQKKSGG